MTFVPHDPIDTVGTILRKPSWITSARGETLEDVAFLSGAALSYLHVVLGRNEVPRALLRDRLALRAAEACVAFSGRPERAPELRDAVHLLRPGDLPGPAGETCLAWRRAVERPLSTKALYRALPELQAERIATWLDAAQGAPERVLRGLGAMAGSTTRNRLSLPQQYLFLQRSKTISGEGVLGPGRLEWRFQAQPTPLSRSYQVTLVLERTGRRTFGS